MTSNELWICVDCRELTETGESSAHAESAKPLSRLSEGTKLLFAGGDRADGGFNDFSNDDCPGCGSRLAGVRFIYVAA